MSAQAKVYCWRGDASIGRRGRAEGSMTRSMEKKSRGPSQRRNERWGRKEGLEGRWRKRKGGHLEKGGSHVSHRMGNGVKDGRVGGPKVSSPADSWDNIGRVTVN